MRQIDPITRLTEATRQDGKDLPAEACVSVLVGDIQNLLKDSEHIFVPGIWRCAKCQFTLAQSSLNASDGTVTARENPGEHCPNDASPMWRVTWKQWAIEGYALAEQYFEELKSCKSATSSKPDMGNHISEQLQTPNHFPDAGEMVRERWRHVARGTTYTVLAKAKAQASTEFIADGDAMIIYQGEDGQVWARSEKEFLDGRFEPVNGDAGR